MNVIRRYLDDDSVKADPVAYAKLYEEVKIEAALVTIVCAPCPTSPHLLTIFLPELSIC